MMIFIVSLLYLSHFALGDKNVLNVEAVNHKGTADILKKAVGLNYLTYSEVWSYFRALQRVAPDRVRVTSARQTFPHLTKFEGPGTDQQR